MVVVLLIFLTRCFEFSGGARSGQGQDRSGNDLRYDMSVSLEEAYSGLQKDITINVPASCGKCDGSGAAGGSKPSTCGTCGGAGRVRAQQGFFAVERTCHACQGMGQVISNPCRECGGDGRVQQSKVLSFPFQQALILEPESDCRARARLGFVAAHLVICISLYR